jgi:MFS family permease
LSYLFRTINTLISSSLTSELGLSAASLGLLGSVYFFAFGSVQIPIGIALDRFGPRRVQSALLVVGAIGAVLFGTASGITGLLIARTLIGIGAAGSLMAGLKAIVIWFPNDRVALVNGYMIMCGALGAVTATVPAEWLLESIGWRGLFEVLSLASLFVAALIYFVVPEKHRSESARQTSAGLRTILSNTRFWLIAPLSAACVGSAWSLQALWAGAWLTDVEGLDRPNLVRALFLMAIEVSLGAWMFGALADRLRRRGVRVESLFAVIAGAFIIAELVLIGRLPVPSLLPWCVLSVTSAATVLSYAIVAEYFPTELTARANGVLNLFHFAWAFLSQCGTGLVISRWPSVGGHYPAIAYQTALGLNVMIQVIALGWFMLPVLRAAIGWDREAAAGWSTSVQPTVASHADSDLFEPCEQLEW